MKVPVETQEFIFQTSVEIIGKILDKIIFQIRGESLFMTKPTFIPN